MRRIAPMLAALAAALALALPASASANTAKEIIHRCTHGESIGGFPPRAYREALQHMPTEVAEYSECAELISNAELAAAGHRPGKHGGGGKSGAGTAGGGSSSGGGSSGGGSTSGSEGGSSTAGATGNQAIPTNPAEHEAVRKAQSSGSAPVQIGPTGAGSLAKSAPIEPGVVHADLASAASSIPAPLLAILALLAALALAFVGRMIVLYVRHGL